MSEPGSAASSGPDAPEAEPAHDLVPPAFDEDGDPTRDESLRRVLGGSRAAIDASIPPVAFLAGWIATSGDLTASVVVSLVASALVLVVALVQRRKPRAVLIGMLATVVAALVATYTGEARNFFLVQLLSNAASALAWAISIAVRWPLLGLVVGALIGTRTRWRRDPVLLRAYSRASWIWVLQYVIRVVVFSVLWWLDETTWLAIMRAALTYPLVIACIAVSGWVLFAAIPRSHPGIRKPQVVEARAA